ncbi:hypothetical protein Lal_00025314 [Lupinus albus]|nr:hypothetical protein Lal_00025314 [Lupinus albus]
MNQSQLRSNLITYFHKYLDKNGIQNLSLWGVSILGFSLERGIVAWSWYFKNGKGLWVGSWKPQNPKEKMWLKRKMDKMLEVEDD